MSTRYNLHSAKYDQQYSRFNPQLNLITLKFDYEPSYYSYCDNTKKIALPTEEELRAAEQYNNKVPKYEIYTEQDGDIQRCGTVKDNPDFENYGSYIKPEIETNLPPPPECLNNLNENNYINDNNNIISTKPKDEAYNSSKQEIIGGEGIYVPPTGGIYSQGSNIYSQPHGGSIYDTFYSQPPNKPQA